jgi:hypothetical protein
MRYLIWVPNEEDEGQTLHAAPVPDEDAAYLRRAISTLQPLSEDGYLDGPVTVLSTLARFSYVLDGETVYWCIEWDPGMWVLRLGPGELAWTALRSPVPDFGGRTPLPEEEESFDEDAENHQYNLVYHPFDAVFEESERTWRFFEVADGPTVALFEAGVGRANTLASETAERMGDRLDEDAEHAIGRLAGRAGEGHRL